MHWNVDPSTLYFGSPACALPTHNRSAAKHEALAVSAKIFMRLRFIDFLPIWFDIAHDFIARNRAGRIFLVASPARRARRNMTLDESGGVLTISPFRGDARRRRAEMGMVINLGWSKPGDEIPQPIGIVISANLRKQVPPFGYDLREIRAGLEEEMPPDD
jgi:hypothetical protein